MDYVAKFIFNNYQLKNSVVVVESATGLSGPLPIRLQPFRQCILFGIRKMLALVKKYIGLSQTLLCES